MDNGGRRERLRPYDLVAADDLTGSVEIWPCGHCRPWHVEVSRREDGTLAVREWHDEHCRHLQALLEEDQCDQSRATEPA